MKTDTKIAFVLIGLGVLLLIGSMIMRGGIVGRAYVRAVDVQYVQVERPAEFDAASGDCEVAEKERVWVSATAPEATAENTTRTDAPQIGWRKYENATMSDYLRNEPNVSFSLSRTIGTWLAAFLTLAIFSFLWGDNPLYKLAESIFIGVSAAYWMVLQFWSVVVPNLLGRIFPIMVQGWAMPGLENDHTNYIYVIPLVLAVMLLWRLAPAGQWISRWPLALFIGVFAGMRMIQFIQADFLNQIRNGILPLFVRAGENAPAWQAYSTSIWNIISVGGVLACLTYFFFSIEHKGAVGRVARLGTWILMITFGAMFAFTVMGRIALLTGRLEFLFIDWLWLIDPTGTRSA